MGDLWSVIFQSGYSLLLFVAFFGASVFFHELGHFLAARKRGLVIDKFAVGFPPIIWKKKYKGVDYCIGAIPFGGFVSLPQLAGAKAIEGETEHRNLPEISWLDKVIVAGAGPAFSLLFAFILGLILWPLGTPVAERMNTTIIGDVAATMEVAGKPVVSPAKAGDLRIGDRIVAIDGQNIADFEDVTYAIILGRQSTPDGNPVSRMTIERDGKNLEIELKPILYKQGTDEVRKIGIGPADKVTVGRTVKNSPGELAGLKPKDRILTWNGQKIWSSSHWFTLEKDLPEPATGPVTVTIEREGKTLELTLQPTLAKIYEDGKKETSLGVALSPSIKDEHIAPWTHIGNALSRSFRTLQALVSPGSNIGLDKMNGPVGIAHVVYYYSQADIRLVIGLILYLNVSLALLNMLPLPVLDGGHITVALLSKLRGKALPETFMAYTQSVFVVMLLGLMLYVVFNDSRRIVHEVKSSQEGPKRLAEPVFEALPVK